MKEDDDGTKMKSALSQNWIMFSDLNKLVGLKAPLMIQFRCIQDFAFEVKAQMRSLQLLALNIQWNDNWGWIANETSSKLLPNANVCTWFINVNFIFQLSGIYMPKTNVWLFRLVCATLHFQANVKSTRKISLPAGRYTAWWCYYKSKFRQLNKQHFAFHSPVFFLSRKLCLRETV